ncbi:hypothetical protein VUR80DRAFT_459 [Thermomyces stellatus]
MLRAVTNDVLKHMGLSLTNARSELGSGRKALNRLSRRAECAFTNWPWPENGVPEQGCTPDEVDPEYENKFPLAVVSRSVNNILKSSYRKMDEQVAETERVRATVIDLREELDETTAACDKALEQIKKQARDAEDLKMECTSLREMVRTLELFKETVTAGERLSDAEKQDASARLDRLEQEVEMYKYKAELFDALCQEVRMLPYSLRNVETARKCLDALRAWVKSKEELLLARWGAEDEDNGEANGVSDEGGTNEDADISFTTCGSPIPASSVSDSLADEEQY